ncbi:MAG: 23S rRNA (adenine(2503)-C(2))-methyltransferase RlmN [Acidobacteria bacterium]|nr:MAG: 23S rRNA (adenine(2503)-C(2))-methyltransferase RlmN [Acidobacteriota bacterium]
MTPLSNDTLKALTIRIRQLGWSETHAQELFRQIHRYGVHSTDGLPARRLPDSMLNWLRGQRFKEDLSWESHQSIDGSVKYIHTLSDGFRVESVYMPSSHRDTICLSSQAGCAMGCGFCATARMGLKKNLRPSEIIHQVDTVVLDQRIPAGRQKRLNLMFMGMGEPLHNLNLVMRAFTILTDRHGLGIPEKDIGISTCGLVPGIRKLAQYEKRPCLMISLGAMDDTTRTKLMPVNNKWPLETLLNCLKQYPLRKRERLMLSYVLIKGQNDTREDAVRLSEFAGELNCLVNLIPYNAHELATDLMEPEEQTIQFFYRTLLEAGVFCTIRRSRGRDIAGACGQLVQRVP